MEDYPTLFDLPRRKLKGVMQDISVLDLESAKEKLNSLILQYPENDEIRREKEIMEMVGSVISEDATPSRLLIGFSSIKKHFESISYLPDYLEDLEKSFYNKVIEAFGEEEIVPVQGYPVGFLLMKAGSVEEAEESLVSELDSPSVSSKNRARLLGYLGDLYYTIGDTDMGRAHYLRAILTDWNGLDKKNIADEDVSSLIAGTYIREGMGGIWAAPVGYMLMVFESGSFTGSDDLMEFYKEFNRLKSTAEDEPSDETSGKLFYYALVIEENGDVFRSLKGTDKMTLRKLMRGLNSKLFKLHTKLSLSKKGEKAEATK